MKYLGLIIAIIFTIPVFSQIEVHPDNRVTIGELESTDSDQYLKIKTKNKTNSIEIDATFDETAGWVRRGIYNRINNNGGYLYKKYDYTFGSNLGSYGDYTFDSSNSEWSKTGTTTVLSGSARYSTGLRVVNYSNIPSNGYYSYGSKYGIYNYIYGRQSNWNVGTYNYINAGSTNNRWTSSTGNYNYIYANGRGYHYGQQNYLYVGNSGQYSSIFGSYNRIYDSSGRSYAYGVYSDIGRSKGYAGYFRGNVYIYGQLIRASDSKTKENIRELKDSYNALEIINDLKPKVYNQRNAAGEIQEGLSFGFLAQDVRSTAPSLVESVEQPGEDTDIEESKSDTLSSPDGEEIITESISRKEQKMDGDTLLAVKYTEVIPILVAAVQQQDQRISSEVDALNDLLNTIKTDTSSSPGNTHISVAVSQLDADMSSLEAKMKSVEAHLADMSECYGCEMTSVDGKYSGKAKDKRVKNKEGKIHSIGLSPEQTVSYNSYSEVINVFSEKSPVAVIIYDEQNTVVTNISAFKEYHEIDLSSWQKGFYKLKIFAADQNVSTQTMVIMHQ